MPPKKKPPKRKPVLKKRPVKRKPVKKKPVKVTAPTNQIQRPPVYRRKPKVN